MCNKEINKVKRGERLLPSLIELEIGSSVEVPFRLYSENSIRSVASRLKATQILGTSRATIYRMKATGALDGCISQYGGWIVFDVNKVLELHKLSHRKKRNKGDGRG